MPAPCSTRESADCWPSYGERIAAQYSTCKFRHVRTNTRPSWPHRAHTVTDMWSLNFDGHGAVYERRARTDIRPTHVSGTVWICVSRPLCNVESEVIRTTKSKGMNRNRHFPTGRCSISFSIDISRFASPIFFLCMSASVLMDRKEEVNNIYLSDLNCNLQQLDCVERMTREEMLQDLLLNFICLFIPSSYPSHRKPQRL
ncbi:hypothetical protein J6590_074113 [Homalodisca vitripennis]|nr:hypothetical protein J6590_074113 [Homalodisca vitripennis]